MNPYEDATHDFFGFGGGGFTRIVQPDHSPLGPALLLSDSGVLSPVGAAHGPSSGSGSFFFGGSAPSPTLVSASGSNLAIDLVWDSSVAHAPTGFTAAVVSAAQAYVSDFTEPTRTVVYIAVGWGEVGGSALASNALGESESVGYLTSYATVTAALAKDGFGFGASNEPTAGQFFVSSAEAKALGLIGATSGGTRSVDGDIGFSTLSGTGYGWSFGAGATATQFNLQSVASHEISEVMGRIGMEGTAVYNARKTFTPLDLFNYSSAGVLELSAAGGYFSNNTGAAHMGVYNNAAAYGGDIADWASYLSPSQSQTVTSGEDSYDAFSAPGYGLTVSADDLLEMAALGYRFTPAGAALA